MSDRATSVERGRAAYGRRDWEDAFAALFEADAAAPLDPGDLHRLTWAASLAGHDDEMLKGLERLYQLHLDAERCEDAALMAFWLAFRLVAMGEAGRAGGWFVRCERLGERIGPDAAVHGYLLLPACRRLLVAGSYEAALATALRAAEIGERCHDHDLHAFARTFEGRVLLGQGHIARGLAQSVSARWPCEPRRYRPRRTRQGRPFSWVHLRGAEVGHVREDRKATKRL